MRDLRAADVPPVLFVHQGDPDDAEDFFARHWPEARAIEDRDLELYRAFGLGRGSLREILGPGALKAGLRALRKGSFVGKPSGDVRVMPGVFLVDRGRVVFAHVAEHVGDHPAEADIRRAHAALSEAR